MCWETLIPFFLPLWETATEVLSSSSSGNTLVLRRRFAKKSLSLSANDVLFACLFFFCGCPRKEATAQHCRRNRERGRRLWPLLSSSLLAHFYAQQNSLLPPRPPPRGVLLLYVHSSDVEQANVRTKQRAASAFADKERVSSVPPP